MAVSKAVDFRDVLAQKELFLRSFSSLPAIRALVSVGRLMWWPRWISLLHLAVTGNHGAAASSQDHVPPDAVVLAGL